MFYKMTGNYSSHIAKSRNYSRMKEEKKKKPDTKPESQQFPAIVISYKKHPFDNGETEKTLS